jgi:D-alanine transaminase/branched-chain amino acid aminotransferase
MKYHPVHHRHLVGKFYVSYSLSLLNTSSVNNRVTFINGQFVEEKFACLHISDLSILRGYGVFDYCRTNNHMPVYLDDHIDRFYRSAGIMHLEVPVSPGELKSIIHQLISKNNISQSGIRMLLTGGYSPDSYEIVKPNLIVIQHPLVVRAGGSLNHGIKVITHSHTREFPQAKTINYTMGIWLQEKLRQSNAVDVLYHNHGVVSEFPRSNFFLVTKDDTVVTPKDNVLLGVTRKKILQLAVKDFAIEERTVTLKDIREAREAFMTSTTRRILPIVQIDDVIIGNGMAGPISGLLDQLLEDVEAVSV